MALPVPVERAVGSLRVLFIGRLDTYKRLDWLLEALASVSAPWQLDVVGDGPKRHRFERLALDLFPNASAVRFLGRLCEEAKLERLAEADLLVLPSDRSNEVFGIVQLEAMAAGRIAWLGSPRSGWGRAARRVALVLVTRWFGRGVAKACNDPICAISSACSHGAHSLFASVWRMRQL